MAVHAGEIEVKKHNLGARDLACIDAFDIPKHLLAVRLHCYVSVESVMLKRNADEPDISRVVLRDQHTDAGGCVTLPGV
jgi:hypothetical protein